MGSDLHVVTGAFGYSGKYIASRTQESVMGVSIPGYLFLDGNWMPDRHASVQQ